MRRWFHRFYRALAFIIIFARELILSNISIAYAVLLRPRSSFRPNFITYDVTGLSKMEILLLSHCITLTPGTTTVDILDDMNTIILHVFDAAEPDAVRAKLDRKLKRPMLEFMR